MPESPARQFDSQWLVAQSAELLVINKPPQWSLLADRSGATSLWELLTARFGKLYLVHRLDKGTSGLLLVARTQALQSRLTRAFERREVTKTYVARVVGRLLLRGTGIIDLPLRPGRKSRYRIAAPRDRIERVADRWQTSAGDARGLDAVTRLRVLAHEPQSTTLALLPRTGRTHQLRVHLSWIGHPILGDHLYGRPDAIAQRAPRLLLHAAGLRVPGFGQWRLPVPF